MPRGGKRQNAGRKATGRQTTKVNVFIEDRELLNSYSKEFNMSVNSFISKLVNNDDFRVYVDKCMANIQNN